MKITDLQPVSAELTIVHPITNEILTCDNGERVVIDVVGRDSPEFYSYQKQFYRKLRDKAAANNKQKIKDKELDDLIVDNLVCCVVGWDKKVNQFFASLDTKKGKGNYSQTLVRKVLTNTGLQWFRNQLDAFITNRTNFFTK